MLVKCINSDPAAKPVQMVDPKIGYHQDRRTRRRRAARHVVDGFFRALRIACPARVNARLRQSTAQTEETETQTPKPRPMATSKCAKISERETLHLPSSIVVASVRFSKQAGRRAVDKDSGHRCPEGVTPRQPDLSKSILIPVTTAPSARQSPSPGIAGLCCCCRLPQAGPSHRATAAPLRRPQTQRDTPRPPPASGTGRRRRPGIRSPAY